MAVTTARQFPRAVPLQRGDGSLRGVELTGMDGHDYRVVANFGIMACTCEGFALEPCSAKVCRLEKKTEEMGQISIKNRKLLRLTSTRIGDAG